jgi:hypothetical protein
MISEFLAVNDRGITDSDGDFSDWIEIHNPTGNIIPLSGYALTDDPDDLSKWSFPTGTILGSGQYLLVFASDKSPSPGGELRVNFKLSGGGEFLGLTDSSGAVIDSFNPGFPPQFTDISYGRSSEGGFAFFPNPTPGQPNETGVKNPATEIIFNPPGGTFTGTLALTLSNADPTAPIYYTTDGSDPTGASPQYSTPLSITVTTRLRARTIRPEDPPGPVITSAYHRLADDVAAFSSPLPIVVIDNFGQGRIPDKRAANPPAGDGGGITQVGRQAARMLIFDRDGSTSSLDTTPAISTRIGARVRGSSSASQPAKKENLSIESWGAIDEEKIDISPFGMPSSDEWVLYAPYNYDRSLVRNALIYELMRRAGHYAPRTQFVELFINTEGDDLSMNDFAGIFVFMEKIERDPKRVDVKKLSKDGSEGGWIIESNRLDPLPANGSGTPPFNFHTAGPNRIKQGPYGGSSGTDRGGDDIPRGYNTFFNFVSPGGYDSTQAQRDSITNWFDQFEDVLYSDQYRNLETGYRRYLETSSFIDHFLLVNISHNVDGLQLSTFLHKPDTYSKLRLNPPWDYDRSMDSYDGRDNPTSGQWGKTFLWFPRLFSDPAFAQNVDDRYQQLRAGVFSTSDITALIDEMAAEITAPVAASNFARWNSSNNRPRSGGWPAEIAHLKSWLTNRLDWLDGQLVTPPVLAASSSQLNASAPDGGAVYFTLDGTDPRLPNVPGTMMELLPETAPAKGFIPSLANGGSALGDSWQGGSEPFDDSAWLSGTTGIGYNYDDLVGLDVSAMRGQNGSAFLRISFEIDLAELPLISELILNLKWEDGFVAYLNGSEVASMNAPTPLVWNSTTGISHSDATTADAFDISRHIPALKEGVNVLAFQVINSSVSNSDLLAVPQLIGTTGSSGGVSPSVIAYVGPTTFTEPQKVIARVLKNGVWSGPVAQHFLVNSIPASATNLALSEIMYRPADASPAEILSDFADRDEFEFLELANTSSNFLDLTSLAFTEGIIFSFANADLRFLAPGERLILVENPEAFTLRYGPGFPIAGRYSGSLSNDGETLILQDQSANPIATITYNDQLPWPTSADGDGDSLELANLANPAALNWLSSSQRGGTPGTTPFSNFTGNPNLDQDNDGLNSLLEFALGTSDNDPKSGPDAIVFHADQSNDQLTFAHFLNLAAGGLNTTIESSPDLLNWSPEPSAQLSERSNNGSGSETRSWVIPQASQKRFFRLKISQ